MRQSTSRIFLAAMTLALVLAGTTAFAHEQLKLVNGDGFGNPNNVGIGRVFSAEGYLFVGTWNTVEGGIVYRSRDGRTFEQISTPGINGNRRNFVVVGYAWFEDMLYIGMWNQVQGGSVFRANADADDVEDIEWETITVDGMGNPQNRAFHGMSIFKNQLYAGTFNLNQGTEIWRTPNGDPGTWTQVAPKGFGQPLVNSDAAISHVHGGYLYFGVESAGAIIRPPVVGTQLWRTDGEDWEQVNVNGFGNDFNHNILGLVTFKDYLYAGTWNFTQGLEVWRAKVHHHGKHGKHGKPGKVPFPNWEKVNENGFGDPARNQATNFMLTHGGKLYLVGYGDGGEGRGIFTRTRNGTRWEEITGPGFNQAPVDGFQWAGVYQGKVYVGAHAGNGPAQLWSYKERHGH
jgi:hypothetical protein